MVNQRSGDGVAGDTLNTQLNTTANNGGSVLSQYSEPTFIFSLSEAVSKRMIDCLQDFFQVAPLAKEFNRRLWAVNKEVIVQDQFSVSDSMSLPQIVVTAVPADHVPVSLGNKLGTTEFNDHLFEEYGGMANMIVTLELYDSGKVNVCQLADIVFLSLMQYVKQALQSTYMTIQPQIKFTNAQKTNAGVIGGGVYKINLTVPVTAEWRQYMEVVTVTSGSISVTSTQDAVTPLK